MDNCVSSTPDSGSMSPQISTPPPPISSKYPEQMGALYAKCQELFKRTRRVQLQQRHRNLTKQMKVFVSQQQKFSTVTCLRYNDRCSVSQNELGQDNKDKIVATIDALRYNLRHLEAKYDSDATDSSSGDDSCDELEESDYRNCTTYSVPEAHTASVSSSLPSTSTSSNLNRHVPTRKRSASWKWCTERSAIASRWSWVQAQVTDLETKLRQQNDIFRHLRAAKGPIVFGEDEKTSSCMRTIPYVSMKRRKLVRSESTLAVAVKKAVQYSSIPCSCNIYPPNVPPCVICTGRYRHSYMPGADSECMPYYERVSLLDSACHSHLCLPNDVPLGVHLTQLLKREYIHSNKKEKFTNILDPLLTTPSADGSLKTKKLTLANSISKPKKKIDKNKKRRLSTDSLKRANRERVSSGCSSRAESPIPSPCPSETSSNGGGSSLTPTTPSAHPKRRRRNEPHAFDINNIVIPYSIAAANRIEKLQYKEIITPKWRVNEEFAIPPPPDSSSTKLTQINGKEEESVGSSNSNNIADSNSLEEDLSDSAFEARHSKYEKIERQRIFAFYLNQRPPAHLVNGVH